MIVHIVCDNENNVIHAGTTPIGENSIEIETDIEDFFTNPKPYKLINGELVPDEENLFRLAKEEKMEELDALCNASIIAGFDYEINGVSYRFSSSLAAQANFQGTDTLFKDGLITDVEWTVINNTTGLVERITFGQEIFNQLKLQIFLHINSNTKKLRNELQPKVEAATSRTELDLITW